MKLKKTLETPSKSLQNTISYAAVKQVIDMLCGILLIILLFPLFLVIGISILIDDGGPVIFRQTRTGKNKRPFTIWKFRTIPVSGKNNSDTGDHEYPSWDSGVPDQFIFKSKLPSGTSRIGKLLRKYSLDELPQLVNVIKGDMSLIGPRPEVPDITRYYNQQQQERLMVKPGITGFAQVSGRSNINHGKKIKYDRYYVHNLSFSLDCKILLYTVRQVIKSEGSY
ncbi:sugar transferase [Lentibacillus kapialis]|uniref:Sugar transferase n=1 Tax=Lentibacillus kapialis TaxID=340214 RepID=A0A917V0W4_9BACI|nr:sugar transferase [Lentibacillus kapialis]GGK05717.1 sugar transferase [Lentibacillus kapialis]